MAQAPPGVFKITPSTLNNLWDECPRCFWLRVRYRLEPPRFAGRSGKPFSHHVVSRYFIGRNTRTLSASLPPGRFLAADVKVKSVPIYLPGCDSGCVLQGRLPYVVRFDDGGWGIVLFTLSDPGAVCLARYWRPLHAYALAVERAAPQELHLAPVTHLGLVCLMEASHRATMGFRPVWIEIDRRDEAFERFLADVVRLLSEPRPPARSMQCPRCRYYLQRREMDTQHKTDRLSF